MCGPSGPKEKQKRRNVPAFFHYKVLALRPSNQNQDGKHYGLHAPHGEYPSLINSSLDKCDTSLFRSLIFSTASQSVRWNLRVCVLRIYVSALSGLFSSPPFVTASAIVTVPSCPSAPISSFPLFQSSEGVVENQYKFPSA